MLLTMFTLDSIKPLETATLVGVDGLNTLSIITAGVLITGR